MTTVELNIAAPSFAAPVIASERDFEDYLRSFSKLYNAEKDGLHDATEKLNVAKHDSAYHRVAEALAMSQVLMLPEHATYLAKNLMARGINLAKDGENAYLCIVRLLFGKWGEEKVEGDAVVQKWKSDRSAEKYANVLRYLNDNNVAPKDVPSKIAEFPGKLKGMEAADRAAHAKSDPLNSKTEKVMAGLKNAKALFRLENKEVKAAVGERQVGAVWFEMDGDEMQIKGVLDLNGAAIDAILLRMAKAIAKMGSGEEQSSELRPDEMEMTITKTGSAVSAAVLA